MCAYKDRGVVVSPRFGWGQGPALCRLPQGVVFPERISDCGMGLGHGDGGQIVAEDRSPRAELSDSPRLDVHQHPFDTAALPPCPAELAV